MRRLLSHLRPLVDEGVAAQMRSFSRTSQLPAPAGVRPQMPQRTPRTSPPVAQPAATPQSAAGAAAAPDASGAAADAGGAAAMPASAASAADAGGAASAVSAAEAEQAAMQRETAKAVTQSFLFPWERRQFSEDNKGLKTWEKLYWGVFVTAIAALLFSRVITPTPVAEPVVDDGKEQKKQEMARAILAGNTSFINDNADVFEGLSPAEIEEYVAQATKGASSSDPFEGMSPEEINAYIEQHGTPAGA